MRLKRIQTTLAIGVVFALAACKGGAPTGSSGTPNPPFLGDPPQDAYVFQGEPGVYGGTLILSTPSDMKTFNVIVGAEASTNDILWYHVHRCLVDFRNGDDPPVYDAGLCTKWEESPDAREWTFHLRRGVRWSDGAPFTADDVVFTYNVVCDKNINNNVADVFGEGRDESGAPIYPDLEKIDDYTVRFKLHQPNGSFLDSIFNLYLLPRHKLEGAWKSGSFGETMRVGSDLNDLVCLGPFRIVDYVSGQRIVLERNPYFWKVDKNGQRLPYLDRIIFVIAKDFNTIMAKFQASEIDGINRVLADQFVLVKRMEGSEIKVEDVGVTHDTNWMAFNQNTLSNPKTGKPFVTPWKLRLFRDQRFRQAVSFAIDREGIANTIYAGRGVPIYSFVTPGDKYWYSDDIMKYPYDPARARQLLADIGLEDSNGDGLLEDAEGHTVEFTINPNAQNAQRTSAAAFIARNLKDVGLKANLSPLATNVISNMLQVTFDFDAIVLGWQTGVPPGPVNAKNILSSSAQLHVCFPNQSKPSSEWEARVDELVKEIDASADEAQRKQMFGEIQRIWSEQLPEINFVAQKEAVAYKTKFHNVKPTVLPPRLTWNCEEIYVK